MPSLAYKTERVLNILRELPPAKVNEVIDFAEYLKAKTLTTKPLKQSVADLQLYHLGAIEPDACEESSRTNSPQKRHKYNFADICGALSWQGDVIATQRSLRDEW